MSYIGNNNLEFNGYRKRIVIQDFFHVFIIQRHQYNHINHLQTISSYWIIQESTLRSYIRDLFSQPYTARPLQGYNQVLSFIPSLVTPVLNTPLAAPTTDEEVHQAVFQLGGNKVLVWMDFLACFISVTGILWTHILCHVVHHFYETGFLLQEFNKTNLALIPKCHHPIGIHQFQPISPCNFIYKVILKTIVNRLKTLDAFHYCGGSKCLCSWQIYSR